jgi:hypothetical protein
MPMTVHVNPPTPPAPPVTPGGRRIEDQPWGHRYWDGHARDAGKTSVAPPLPPKPHRPL